MGDTEAASEQPKESVADTEKKVVKLPDFQHVIITLADGRRGVFSGPALVSKGEMVLNMPRLRSVDFSEPKPMMVAPEVKEEPASENKGPETEGSK